MKRLLVVALALISAACNASDSSPITPDASSVSLRDGPYTLRVTRAATATCFSLGGGAGTVVQLDMTVTALSDGWRVGLADSAGGDLVLTLVRQGSGVTGRGVGRGRALTLTLILDNVLRGGRDGTPTNAAGSFDGTVTYSGTAGDTICTDNSWTLAPR